jgi:hypothetical protein
MARSRNIKPGFFANDLLAEVPPLGRLLFAGLWTLADREGRLEDRPKKIRAQIFPYDECDVDGLLDELARRQFIQRYEVDGLRLIQVRTWHKHQNPHIKEPASTLPAPDKYGARPVLLSGHHAASTAGDSIRGGATSSENSADLMVILGETGAEAIFAPVSSDPESFLASAHDGKSTGSCRADSRFLIPDSLSPDPDSTPPPTLGSKSAPVEETHIQDVDDSDKRKKLSASESVIPSLGTIANKVRLQFSPPEVAGFIMAHFPMQQVDFRQRPTQAESGLALEQVNCIVRHGCTIEKAKRALEHFRQEKAPARPGAWAFHCLKEELSADERIDLREETRSAQREFRERTAGLPSPEGSASP